MMPFVASLLLATSLGGGGGPPTPGDPYWRNVALLLDATDGTATVDQSRNAIALTLGAGVTTTGSKYTFSGGTTGKIDPAGGNRRSLWVPGSKFTMELWGVNFAAITGVRMLISLWSHLADSASWTLAYVAGTGLIFQVSQAGGTTISHQATAAWTPTIGVDYDIAAAWDGSFIRLYIDGVYQAKVAFSAQFYAPNTQLRIGYYRVPPNDTGFFSGSFKALRFTRGVDRAAANETTWADRDVLPLYKVQEGTATTDPLWDDVLLLAEAQTAGAIVDRSPFDWKLKAGGAAAVSTGVQPIAGVNSISLPGAAADIVSVEGQEPLLTFDNDDFTVETWARHSSVGVIANGDRSYVSKYAASAGNRAYWFAFRPSLTPDELQANFYDTGSVLYTASEASFTPTVGQFYHMAHTRGGSLQQIWRDGVKVAEVAIANTQINPAQPLVIGGLGSGDVNRMVGYLSEVRITRGTARYTAGFSPPTAAFPRG